MTEYSNQSLLENLPVQDQLFILSERLKGKPWKIGVDGQAAVGKGTAVEALSNTLGLEKIETGNMYRAVAYWLINFKQVQDPEFCSDSELSRFLKDVTVDFVDDASGLKRVMIYNPQLSNPMDVTGDLQDPKIGKIISRIAKRDPVRDMLENQQIALLRKGKTVIEGRDMWKIIGSYADILVYLYADDETLMKREMKRQSERGTSITVETAREIVVGRNYEDYHRTRGKLMTPEEAADSQKYDSVIDTSDLTPDMVTLQILKTLDAKNNKPTEGIFRQIRNKIRR